MATLTYNPTLDAPDIVRDFTDAIAAAQEFDDAKDARAFCQFYEEYLKQYPTFFHDKKDLQTTYEDLYQRAMWVAFPLLSEKDGFVLFEKYLPASFTIAGYDYWSHLRKWLLSIPLENRDAAKKKISDILVRSEMIITPRADNTGPQTAGEWVRQFQLLGAGSDALARNQFIFTDKTFTSLTPTVQERVRAFFALLERLQKSSLSPEGFEEDIVMRDGENVILISEGEFQDLSAEEKKLLAEIRKPGSPEDEQQRLVELLRGNQQERATVAQYEETLAQETSDDPQKLRDTLWQLCDISTQAQDPLHAAAVLKHLARLNKLDTILRDDPRYADLLEKYYRVMEKNILADDAKVYPTSPKHIATLIQILLCLRCQMDVSDAARYALQCANLLKQQGKEKYLDMAYFDQQEDIFRIVAAV